MARIAAARGDCPFRSRSASRPPRDEEYRFTNIGPIADTDFRHPASGTHVDRAEFAEHLYGDAVAAELVFVDGRFVAALSSVDRLPTGVTAGSLTEVLKRTPELCQAASARWPGKTIRR